MAGIGRHHADEAIMIALAGGMTQQQAAKHAGVSEKTIRNRLADPVFKQKIADYRANLLARTADRLTAVGLKAVTALEDLLEAESESVRLGAARTILELGPRIREVKDFEERLLALEAQEDQEGPDR